jgi:hypothetical protein
VAAVTLVEFLTARLAEDENTARAAGHGCGYIHEHNAGWVEVSLPGEHNARPSYELRFIKRYDPARVLREIEAKRRIIELHVDGEDHECEPRLGEMDWTTWSQPLLPCPTLRLLGLSDADHPDYREEWKP